MSHIEISTAVALIVGYAAAHAAGLLTKAHAPAWVLGAVSAVLAALAGVLPTVAWNEGQSWQAYTVNVFAALIAVTLGHKSQIPQALRARTAHVGVGRKHRAV